MGQTKSIFECFGTPDYIVSIKTGDTKGSGLHNSADIILINERNEHSRKIQLSGCCVTVFKKGRTDNFKVQNLADFGEIKQIIIEQHRDQSDVEWYIDKVIIWRKMDGLQMVFPVHRWLRNNRPLPISKYDACLPQYDPNIEHRQSELNIKRIIYSYSKTSHHKLPQMNTLPRDEVFSNFYKWNVTQKRDSLFSIYRIVPNYEKLESWKSFEEIENLFKEKGKFRKPAVLNEDWKSDAHFGRQRLYGCNPRSLQLCKSIPENFAVTEDMVTEYLESFSLSEALEQNRIFIVNHSILDGILDSENNQIIPSPMALFYLDSSENLMPIAIQLYQDSEKSPVFVPNDPCNTWLLAKMWFNNADATFQRVCLLFVSSHWILGSITLSIHRNLSPSHPIFRLLAPYIRLVLAINNFEVRQLTDVAWADQFMTIKSDGVAKLTEKYWEKYDFKKNCNISNEMEDNQIGTSEVIGEYPYRDDGLLLHACIMNYVNEIVTGYYNTEKKLLGDEELQNWAKELVNENTCGLKNMYGDGSFTNKEDVTDLLTCIIYKATVEHAALNLPLYDEGAFVPNYPLMMRGEPPTSKDVLTEADVMAAIPTRHVTMELVVINKVLSERDSSGLADSRAIYQYDPIAEEARSNFRRSLHEAAQVINLRNNKRTRDYDYLNPKSARVQVISS